MRTAKRQVFLALAGVWVAGLMLQGCGGGGGGDDPTTTPAPTPPPTPPPPPTPAPPSEVIENPFCPSPSLTSAVVDKAILKETIGYPATGAVDPTSKGKWCEVKAPPQDWNLKNFCPSITSQFKGLGAAATQIKILTYNLQWWANYEHYNPPNTLNPALGQNMAQDDAIHHFDLMGFQECENIDILMASAKSSGLAGDWGTFELHEGKSIGIGMAWNKATFDYVAQGKEYVAEDRSEQHYGRRAAQWVRLIHKASGAPVFYLNHHGPTPVNTGGMCGAKGTAYNVLKAIANNAQKGDLIFMTCDCNNWSLFQPPESPQEPWKYNEEIGTLACHIPHSFTHPVIEDCWGIDNFFSNCAVPSKHGKGVTVKNAGTIMGKGGSDHFALSLIYDVGGSESVASNSSLVFA